MEGRGRFVSLALGGRTPTVKRSVSVADVRISVAGRLQDTGQRLITTRTNTRTDRSHTLLCGDG